MQDLHVFISIAKRHTWSLRDSNDIWKRLNFEICLFRNRTLYSIFLFQSRS